MLAQDYDPCACTPRPTARPSPTRSRAVGDRWTLLVVGALLGGPRRFSELLETSAASRRTSSPSGCATSSARRCVVAHALQERPPRFVYELTARGARARRRAAAARRLGRRATPRRPSPPRHAACGTPLEARWYCPTCERTVDEDEADELEYI